LGDVDDLFDELVWALAKFEKDEAPELVCGSEGKAGRAFARMPTHAVRLHEWGTQGYGLNFMCGPPAMNGAPKVVGWFHVWGTRLLCMGHPTISVRDFATLLLLSYR